MICCLAAFTSNPHITPPSRGDYYPPVPLHPHPARQSFPASTIPRSASIPPVTLPERDPFAPSSLNGAFSTSLKGTRAMLRKRGRRVESLVGIVEEAIRGWLSGPSWTSDDDEVHGCWRVIDKTLVDVEANEAGSSTSPSSPVDRRLPSQHQIKTTIPPLPQSSTNKRCPAILELSRSPAHLSWAVADPFERLVVHLLVRYYELISWSTSVSPLELVNAYQLRRGSSDRVGRCRPAHTYHRPLPCPPQATANYKRSPHARDERSICPI